MLSPTMPAVTASRGVQALHLAMKCADMVLESADAELAWLGEKGSLGMPKFLPDLPKPQQDRLQSIVDREVLEFWKGLERAHKAKSSRGKSTKRKRARIAR